MQQGDLVGRDVAKDAHGQAWAGERLTPNDFIGQFQFGADSADFVFEQEAERLDQTESEVGW